MFSRKLKALGYHHPDQFNYSDNDEFRNCIVWLEDKKIRLYKIEERAPLRDTRNKNWDAVFQKYLSDLACPVDRHNHTHVLSWLLSHAVSFEFSENAEEFRKKHEERLKRKEGLSQTENHLDTDFLGAITSEHPDLKAGIASLSKVLSLPHHHDHIVVLQAIQKLIHEQLSEDAIALAKQGSNPKQKGKPREGDFIPVKDVNLGFETNDSAINEAAKIVRLLHLRELRDLQTLVNKAIVSAQTVTANPKTDESLGRVGR